MREREKESLREKERERVMLGASPCWVRVGRTVSVSSWAYKSLRPDGADDEEGQETGNNDMWHLVSCGT